MKNMTIVWIVIAVVLVGGAWYYFANSSAGTATPSTVATTTETAATAPAKTTTKSSLTATKKPTATTAKIVGLGPIPSLIALKQSLVCNVKTTSGYSRVGIMYVADGKVRANFSGSSMIDDGVHLYAWMTGAIKGIVLLAASSASGSAIATNGGIDLASDISYACNPWAVDASVFTPPASVSFFSSL